jgi:hypothetical protein
MRLHECKPFEWYFVVTCSDCKTKQALFHDASNGKARIRRTYVHECDQCKSKAFYEPEELERYQHLVEQRKQHRK